MINVNKRGSNNIKIFLFGNDSVKTRGMSEKCGVGSFTSLIGSRQYRGNPGHHKIITGGGGLLSSKPLPGLVMEKRFVCSE